MDPRLRGDDEQRTVVTLPKKLGAPPREKLCVTPAKAGAYPRNNNERRVPMDPRLRGDDETTLLASAGRTSLSRSPPRGRRTHLAHLRNDDELPARSDGGAFFALTTDDELASGGGLISSVSAREGDGRHARTTDFLPRLGDNGAKSGSGRDSLLISTNFDRLVRNLLDCGAV